MTASVETASQNASLAAFDFFSLVVGEGKTVLLRPIETWIEGGKKKSKVLYKAISYQPCRKLSIKLTLDRLSPFAEQKHANLFYGVCPRFGGKGQYDQAWAIRELRTLWADVDGCSPSDAQERCAAAGLPKPSIVVSSGNGAHLYWLLAEPYLIDDAPPPPPVLAEWIDQPDGKKKKREWIKDAETGEKLYLDHRGNIPRLSPKALQAQDVMAGIAAKTGGDHTQDLSRLLRVPGTFNRKDQRNGRPPVPCEIVSNDPSLRYSFADFERFAKESPSKVKREQLRAIPLPTPRRVPPGKRDKLNELITASAFAPIGERSQRDFDLCCFAIRHGVPQVELWTTAQTVGKFAEAGERYFLRTWAAAEEEAREQLYRKVEAKHGFKSAGKNGNGNVKANGHAAANGNATAESEPEQPAADLTNFDEEQDGEGKTRKAPRPINGILANWRSVTGDWPRRVGSAMFIPRSDTIDWIKTPAALFGWASAKSGVIEWSKGTGLSTKDELFAEMARTATAYDAIEPLPHFPPVPNHYYVSPTPQPGDGKTLYALLTRFAPATSVDLDLILAALATIFWGGDGGCRPAFVITSDAGRGAGKSTVPKMLGYLAGGTLDFSPKSEIDKIKTRLLSGDGASKRVALLDNIKTLRFSWGELEGLITAPWISGHRMFYGEGDRPNRLTWFLTLNGASLSTDMAQRCVIIKVAQSIKSGEWEDETKKFILDNRQAIIADVAAFFAAERFPPARYSRWGTWERDVLARLPEPEEAQRVILERQAEADTERDDHEQVEDFFAERLAELGYDTDAEKIFIPSETCCRWLCWATNASHRTGDATRIIKQAATEGVLKRIRVVGRSYGRGFLWVGEEATGKTAYSNDIKERIAELMQKRAEKQAEEKAGGQMQFS